MGKFIVVVSTMLFLAGCNMEQAKTTASSVNMQRALLNSGGQVATVAAIDSSNHKVERISETKRIVVDIRKLVNEGQIGAITLLTLQTQLNKIVPPQYQIYIVQVMAACSGLNVPTDRLGINNVNRINEVLDGIEIRCERYVIEAVEVKDIESVDMTATRPTNKEYIVKVE